MVVIALIELFSSEERVGWVEWVDWVVGRLPTKVYSNNSTINNSLHDTVKRIL